MLNLPIQTLYLFTTLSYLGKGKAGESRMVIILEPLLFYTSATLTGRASEASEERVRNCPAVRLETFILILPSQGPATRRTLLMVPNVVNSGSLFLMINFL